MECLILKMNTYDNMKDLSKLENPSNTANITRDKVKNTELLVLYQSYKNYGKKS